MVKCYYMYTVLQYFIKKTQSPTATFLFLFYFSTYSYYCVTGKFVLVRLVTLFTVLHSWSSASTSMPPESVFRHPTSQSCTEVFRYRTEPSYSGTGLIPKSALFFISVPEWQDAGHSGLKKTARPHCWLRKRIHPARPHCRRRKRIKPARPHCRRRRRIHPARPHCWGVKGNTLHVHIVGDVEGYTLHVHIVCVGEGYTLHVLTLTLLLV